jgi:hypothetical protein
MKTLIAIAALALCACASSPPAAPPPCERVPLTRVQTAELRGPEGWEKLLAARNAEMADAQRKECRSGPPR